MNADPKVRTGLDELAADNFALLRGLRIGVVANVATVNCRLRAILALMRDAKVRIERVFGPEHGFHLTEQDLIAVPDGSETAGSDRVVSLYGATVESLAPSAEQMRGLDALVIDLPDIGSRYYTFQATMLKCMESASQHRVQVFVLDRPNPLGGDAVEGPTIQAGFTSFVGEHPIPVRHGLTLGELARLYHAERKLTCDLHVVPCAGWPRSMTFDETGLPWVLPSPNMPTLETAWVYPGQCLLEGTNLSEGRGTTRPFELCGAPWVDERRLADRLMALALPGVIFRSVRFRPLFHKYVKHTCCGVQIHVTDRRAFQPVRCGLAVLHALRQESLEQFRWRTEAYEFVADRPAIDLLFGSDRERNLLEAGAEAATIAANWVAEEEAFRERRKPFLLY